MHHVRHGAGKPILLVHGLGGSWRSWQLIQDGLTEAGREVIAIDLPGHGDTPALEGETSIKTLAGAVTAFLTKHNLLGIDAVGSSMGARLLLELARRGGVLGAVVSLDPGGFWQGWEIPAFYYSVAGSVRLVRLLQPAMPALTGNAIGRSLLLAQFSAQPWKIDPDLALDEMHSFAASTSFDELLYQLAYGERQRGAAEGSIAPPLVIGWGRNDRVCLPRQASRVQALFPDAHLHWFTKCGHFPQWDKPDETVRLIVAATSGMKLMPQVLAEDEADGLAGRSWAAVLGVGVALALGGFFLLRRRA